MQKASQTSYDLMWKDLSAQCHIIFICQHELNDMKLSFSITITYQDICYIILLLYRISQMSIDYWWQLFGSRPSCTKPLMTNNFCEQMHIMHLISRFANMPWHRLQFIRKRCIYRNYIYCYCTDTFKCFAVWGCGCSLIFFEFNYLALL